MPYKPNPQAPAGVSPKWVERYVDGIKMKFGLESEEWGLGGTYTVVPRHAVIHSGYVWVYSSRATVRVIAFEAGVRYLCMAR